MTNDIVKEIAERMTLKFSEMFVTADGRGNAILTDEGKLISVPRQQIDFRMKWKYSTWKEWLDEIASAPKNNAAKVFPFMYWNSLGTVRDKDTITYPNIIFAVPTMFLVNGHDAKTVDRDNYSFRPLLNNFHRLFYDALRVNTNFSIVDEGERVDHYFYGKYGLNGGEGNLFPDKVDCIERKNLKLRMYKC